MTATQLEHDWYPGTLPANVVLGEGSWLYSAYAFLRYRSERPQGVRVGHHSGVYVWSMFDLGPDGEVSIGDYCTVAGPLFSTNGRITIGDYAFVSYQVVFADSAFALPPAARRDGRPAGGRSAAIEVGDDVWIGTRTVILGGARIGTGAIIGAGAVVDFEVPDYAIVAGNPARVVGWAHPQQGVRSAQETGASR